MVVFFTHNMGRQDLLILLTSAFTTVCVLWYCYQSSLKMKFMIYIKEILIGHPHKCLNVFRMSTGCFIVLASELRCRDLLRDCRTVSVQEQLSILLLTVGHSERNRIMDN